MIRKSIYFLVALCALFLSAGQLNAQSSIGDWQIHSPFDYYFEKVIDTPQRTYVQALAQGQYEGAVGYEAKFPFLFVYDKEYDEFLAYTSRNYLSEDIVTYMAYNADKGYLLIVYENSNIDLLYDDNSVYNIPGLMSSELTTSKEVNHVTFDPADNRAYVATKFGYIVINDDKKEIAESHIYNIDVNSVGRVGNRLLLFTNSSVYTSDIDDHHLSMTSFKVVSGISEATMLMPLADDKFAYRDADSNVKLVTFAENGEYTTKGVIYDTVQSSHNISGGAYFLRAASNAYHLSDNGEVKKVAIPQENRQQCFSSDDFKEFWFVTPRAGLSSKKVDNEEWTVTRQEAMPNNPAVYRAITIEYSDKYGMVVGNEGMNSVFTTNWVNYRHLISAYKDNCWSNMGGAFTSSPYGNEMRDGYGPAFDPDNEDIIYIGSYTHGLFRYDIENDVVTQYSYATDKTSSLDGFNTVFPTSTWTYCKVSKPTFDSDRTMWLTHDTQSVSGGANSLYYWTSEDRKADNISGFKSIPVKGFESKHFNVILPLKRSKNLIVLANGIYDGPMWVYDHNGTLDNTSDDRVAKFANIYDQDGNTIPKTYIYAFFEDQSSGKVWVCTYNGVFTFNPKEAFDSDFKAQRIKVARNDGTNLADYLLDGIPVYNMTADGANRKWFATDGSGVVLTSSDGSEIIRQLNTDNSYIPHNTAYNICCNPKSNSVIIGSHFGVAEYFSDASPAQNDYDNVISYPNPVRPDYYGWVTIEGLMDNSLVKIVDASGGLVKELGRSSGGMITWDVTNIEGKRVKTGVYYVVSSQSGEGETMSNVSKIMVVN